VALDEEAKRATLDFDEFVSALPATLAIGGALVYGVLIVAYSEFYAELGVRPAEVGLEFGPGLGGLAGVAIILIVLLALSTALTLLYVRFFGRTLPELKRLRLWLLGLNVVFVSAVLLFGFSQRANEQADNVKEGTPVEPFRLIGLEILSFRADLARVELADPKAAESEAYKEIAGADKLLYLGRADGAVVLYEPGRQSSWRLPTSAFAVRTLNCETNKASRDPECPD
jgi:hypothetical protein